MTIEDERYDPNGVERYQQNWDELLRVGEDIDVLLYADGTLRLRHICSNSQDERVVRRAPVLVRNFKRKNLTEIPLRTTEPMTCGLCGLTGEVVNSSWRPFSYGEKKQEFVKDSVFRIDWDEQTTEWLKFSKDPEIRKLPLGEMIEAFWAARGGRELYFDYKPAFGYVPRVFLRGRDGVGE